MRRQERILLKRTIELFLWYLFTWHNGFKNRFSLVLQNPAILQHLQPGLRWLISWAVCEYVSAISIWWKGKHWPCQIWVTRSTGLIYYSKLLSDLLSTRSKDIVFSLAEFFNDKATILPGNKITSTFYWAIGFSPPLSNPVIFCEKASKDCH